MTSSKKAMIKLKKTSANEAVSSGSSCYSLKGAVYTVYSDEGCTKAAYALTTGDDGAASVEVVAGTYWVKETTAAPGYALDATVYPVTVAVGKTEAVNGGTVTDIPQNDPANMIVAKVDKSTGEASPLGKGTLAGAEFTVRFYAGQYTKDNLSAQATRTWVFKTNEDGVAVFKQSYLVSGDELWTNSNGVPTLLLGTVSIQETKAPTGYLLTDTSLRVQNITAAGTAETVRTFVEPDEGHPSSKQDSTSAPAVMSAWLRRYLFLWFSFCTSALLRAISCSIWRSRSRTYTALRPAKQQCGPTSIRLCGLTSSHLQRHTETPRRRTAKTRVRRFAAPDGPRRQMASRLDPVRPM